MTASTSGNFDVILFDVGGVLLTNGWDHNERAVVLAQFAIDRPAFEARHEQPYDAWERDLTTAEDYLNATLFYEPRNFTPADFIEAMKAQSVPIPATGIPVLKEVASTSKYLVGLLNNESRLLHEYRMEKYGLESYLDLQLSSCYLALRKPEPAIYHRALDILGVSGQRVLFIDDRLGNCDAARAAGMQSIQFKGEDHLRAALKELEIL